MNKFLFFSYGNRMLIFFYLVNECKYWKQSTNTTNIVLLSPNPIADFFRLSDNHIKFVLIIDVLNLMLFFH